MPSRTTLSLDEEVRAKLETEMWKSGKSFKETVNDTLRLGLLTRQEISKEKPYKVQAKDLGLKPGYNLDKTWGLIEEIEGPYYK